MSRFAKTGRVTRTAPRALAILAASLTLLAPATAQADSFYNVAVTGVGVQGGQMYISSNSLPAACGGLVYLQLAHTAHKADQVTAVALSSRVSAMPLTRLDVTVGSPCTIDLIQL